MFADALLDSQTMGHSRRGWATLTSFGLQAIAVACLLILPLFYTQVLPLLQAPVHIINPPSAPISVLQAQPHQQSGDAISLMSAVGQAVRMPSRIPTHTISINDPFGPILPITVGTCNQCADTSDPRSLVAGAIGDKPGPVLAPQQKPHPLRVSAMMEGSLIHPIDPSYPPIAKAAGIQGSVILAAVIGRDGSVQNLQVVSGHPLLVQAALNAVSQWRYRPYILNGAPIEVDTRITVNFILSR